MRPSSSTRNSLSQVRCRLAFAFPLILTARAQSSMNKPYFIDPETAAFQDVDINRFLNSKGGIRISWKKLGKHYGSVIMDALENRVRLRTTDFLNNDNSFKPNVQELTARVLSFQTSVIRKTVSGLSLFFKEKPQEKMGLQFVVAPISFLILCLTHGIE